MLKTARQVALIASLLAAGSTGALAIGAPSASAATSLTVTINQIAGQPDPTDVSPVIFWATFSQQVSGFDGADISLSGSTAGGTLNADVTGGPQTYQVAIRGMTTAGSVIPTIPADAATDAALDESLQSTSVDNTVAWTTSTVNPTLTTAITPKAKTRGWYHSVVSIRFACKLGTAPLVNACPAPVRFAKNGRSFTTHAVILATDGGSAGVHLGPIQIDRTKPTLQVVGVKSGKLYRNPPKLTCVAHDALSGVHSCVIKKSATVTKVEYVATATDVAGNRTVQRGHYFLS